MHESNAADLGEFAGLVEPIIQQATAHWPADFCARPTFIQYLQARLPQTPADRKAWQRHGADLCLACACLEGSAAAHGELSRLCGAVVDGSLRGKVRLSDQERQLVLVELEKELLFGSNRNAQPKLASYGGLSSLKRWVLSVASRIALNLIGRNKKTVEREQELDEKLMDAVFLVGDDPELLYVTKLSYPVLRAAFAQVLAGRHAEERLLLRLRLVDGLSQVATARLLGCHHATVGRREVMLCQDIARQCRDVLQALGLSSREVQELVDLLTSRLVCSLAGMLREAELATPAPAAAPAPDNPSPDR